jgi:hypothetical protein
MGNIGGVVVILEPRAEYQFEKVLGYTDVWLAKTPRMTD